MKSILVAGAAAAVLAIAASPATAAQPELKFTTLPIVESTGVATHKVYPYRNEDAVAIVVVDPIACGQKPVNARYEISGNRLIIRYDLTKVPEGTKPAVCVANSSFEIQNVPHTDLTVHFAGGTEPFVVADMVRCPNKTPVIDLWDCLVPRK